MKEKILELRKLGKTYNEIHSILGCSKSTISYHCGLGQKTKNQNRTRKLRNKQHPLLKKLNNFISKHRMFNQTKIKNTSEKLLKHKYYQFTRENMNKEFTFEELHSKIGDNPICYLTGENIDINHTSSYQFDHIIPKSRGGNNSLDNLGICTKQVNQAKSNLTPDEFIFLCKKVLEHNGYQVTK